MNHLKMFNGYPYQTITVKEMVKLLVMTFDGTIKGMPISWRDELQKTQEIQEYTLMIAGSFSQMGSTLFVIWCSSLNKEESFDTVERFNEMVPELSPEYFGKWMRRLASSESNNGPLYFIEDLDKFADSFFTAIENEKNNFMTKERISWN